MLCNMSRHHLRADCCLQCIAIPLTGPADSLCRPPVLRISTLQLVICDFFRIYASKVTDLLSIIDCKVSKFRPHPQHRHCLYSPFFSAARQFFCDNHHPKWPKCGFCEMHMRNVWAKKRNFATRIARRPHNGGYCGAPMDITKDSEWNDNRFFLSSLSHSTQPVS